MLRKNSYIRPAIMDNDFGLVKAHFDNVVRTNNVNKITVAIEELLLMWKRGLVGAAAFMAFNEGLSPAVVQSLASKAGLRYSVIAPGVFSLR